MATPIRPLRPILVDTSAWIEYDRATGSVVDERLTALMSSGAPIAVTEPVIMEVVAGARTDRREADLRRLLGSFGHLPFEATLDFDGSIGIYRRCRQSGITPRGFIDCLIAAVARRHGATVLAFDADFSRVADVIGLELDEASRLL